MDYSILWELLSFFAVLLAVSFGYMYHKDNDKRKLIFALSFLVASPNHILMNQGWKNVEQSQGLLWGILPIIAAVLIVVISSLREMKDFDKPFKAFVIVLVASMLLMFAPISAKTVLPPLIQSITAFTIVVSVYLYIKKRETSNLMFLCSIICFAIAGIGTGLGLEAYFNTFTYLFAYMFIGLVFLVSKDNVHGDVASFFSLKNELENTKKELKTSQERLTKVEPVFTASTDAITILDIHGNIVDCNQATLNLLGASTKMEIIGKNTSEFISAKDQQKVTKTLERAKDSKPFEAGETITMSKDGNEFPTELHASVIKNDSGTTAGFLIIANDITKRRQMEEKLRQYSDSVEDLVKKRTEKLTTSQEMLVESERLAAIGEAATMVGHDLRNPLQAIENATYFLGVELANVPVSEKGMEAINVIHRSIDYADDIVNDLLCFASSRIPVLMKTDLNNLIKETLLQINQPENVKTVLELVELPKIEIDKQMIKRVFVNLADNAVQSMEHKGGVLRVTSKRVAEKVVIEFQDTGYGIKPENMEKMFTPFFTTKAQGMGVGLATCKRFVELHSGSIKVKSNEGEGSTFTVTLHIQLEGGATE